MAAKRIAPPEQAPAPHHEPASAPDPALLAYAVDHNPDGVVVVDRAGVIVYANRAMLALAGADDLRDMSVDELVPATVRDRHAGLRGGYAEAPTQRPMGAGLQLEMERRNGERVPVEIALSPFELGDNKYVIAAVRDISERLEDEHRLNVAHEQLALLGERERIGRDLHDVVLQHLYGMGLTTQAIASIAEPTIQGRLEAVVDDIDRIISEVRTIVFTLGTAGRRGALGQELADVVAQASRVLGFTPALRMQGPVESVLTAEVRTEMVASMREALGNVARHAKASKVEVAIEIVKEQVVMTVSDNGVGPPQDETAVQRGHGLVNLRSRAEAFGGSCALLRHEPSGAVLRWWAPY